MKNLVQIIEKSKGKRNVAVVDFYSNLEILLIFPVTGSTLLVETIIGTAKIAIGYQKKSVTVPSVWG